jgi:hypothetical protein
VRLPLDSPILQSTKKAEIRSSRVAGAIEPPIKCAEIGRANTKPITNLDAYDLFLRALSKYYQWTRADNDMVVLHHRAAIEFDPAYALAKAFLSFDHVTRGNQGWGETGDGEKSSSLGREAMDRRRHSS